MGFWVIGGIGLAVLLVSLLVGEFFDTHGLVDSDIFSIASLSAFASALGFTGAGVQAATGSMPLAVAAGVVMGLLFSAFTIWFTRRVRGLRTSDTVTTRSLLGREARVLTPVPEGGYGQVTVRVAGHLVTYSAKAPVALAAGQRVWVSNVLSATAVEVNPTDAIGAAPTGAENLPPA